MFRYDSHHSAPSIDLISRRGALRAGGFTFGGLALADLLQGQVQSETARPKAAILIFLSGGPSHVDMYDMKPDAPVEYRGEFRPIQSNTPGIDVCELMPLQAQIADRFTILRGSQSCEDFRTGIFIPETNSSAGIPGRSPRVRPYLAKHVDRRWDRLSAGSNKRVQRSRPTSAYAVNINGSGRITLGTSTSHSELRRTAATSEQRVSGI